MEEEEVLGQDFHFLSRQNLRTAPPGVHRVRQDGDRKSGCCCWQRFSPRAATFHPPPSLSVSPSPPPPPPSPIPSHAKAVSQPCRRLRGFFFSLTCECWLARFVRCRPVSPPTSVRSSRNHSQLVYFVFLCLFSRFVHDCRVSLALI